MKHANAAYAPAHRRPSVRGWLSVRQIGRAKAEVRPRIKSTLSKTEPERKSIQLLVLERIVSHKGG